MDLIQSLPTPLALLADEYFNEMRPFVKIHRMVDLAEMVVRFFSIITISDIYENFGGFPRSYKKILIRRLARPTFGGWVDLLNGSLRVYQNEEINPFIPELLDVWESNWRALIGSNNGSADEQILPLRNNVAHAGRLLDAHAKKLLNEHTQRFESGLEKLKFFINYRLIAVKSDYIQILIKGLPDKYDWSLSHLEEPINNLNPGQVYLTDNNRDYINLFPLQAFDIINLSESEIGDLTENLNQPSAQVYLRYTADTLEFTAFDPDFYFSQQAGQALEAFRSKFTFAEWNRERDRRENEINNYGYKFDDLKDQYQFLSGRERQLKEVQDWVEDHIPQGGKLWIGGKAGVGKSALLFALHKYYLSKENILIACQIPFFFLNGDGRCSRDDFFRAAILKLSLSFDLGYKIDPNTSLYDQLQSVLRSSLKKIPTTASILFLIDGIDEIDHHEHSFTNLLYSFAELGVIVICSGRNQAPINVDLLWEDGELPPLQTSDVRGWLVEETGALKYHLFKRDQRRDQLIEDEYRNKFVESLTQVSEGLPIYIQLTIQDLKDGRLNFNDEYKLPKSLESYFEKLLQRHEMSDIGQLRPDILILLCLSMEPLPSDLISVVLAKQYPGSDFEQLLEQALANIRSMIRIAPTPDKNMGWTIYHERLRTFLLSTPSLKIGRTRNEDLILEWCRHWKEHLHPYVLRNFPIHLAKQGRWNELHRLIAEGDDVQEWAASLFAWELGFTSYLKGIRLAWQHADEQAKQAQMNIGHQVFYALIESSVQSISDQIPAPLIQQLVKLCLMKPDVALEYIRNSPDPRQRIRILGGIAPYLDQSNMDEAIDLALSIDNDFQTDTLVQLIPHFTSTDQINQIKSIADKKSHGERDRLNKAIAIKYARLGDIQGAIDVAILLNMKWDRKEVFTILASHKDFSIQLLKVMEKIDEKYTAEILQSVGSNLPENDLPIALSKAQSMHTEENKRESLLTIMKYLPEPLFSEVLVSIEIDTSFTEEYIDIDLIKKFIDNGYHEEALNLAKICDNFNCPKIFEYLAPNLNGDELSVALDIAWSKDLHAADAIIALIPYLPKQSLQDALEKIISLDNHYTKIKILKSFPANLPSKCLNQALRASIEISDKQIRPSVFIHIANLFPNNELLAVMGLAWESFSEWHLTKIILGLVNRFTEPTQRFVLSNIKDFRNEGGIIQILVALFPNLSYELKITVLKSNLRISDSIFYTEFMSGVAPYVPYQHKEEFVESIRTNSLPQVRSEILTGLLLSIEQNEQEQYIQEVLNDIQQVDSLEDRIRLFEKLIRNIPLDKKWEILKNALVIIRQFETFRLQSMMLEIYNPGLIKSLLELIPTLRGTERLEAVEVALMVIRYLDVNWWIGAENEGIIITNRSQHARRWRIETLEKISPYISDLLLEDFKETILSLDEEYQPRGFALLISRLPVDEIASIIADLQERNYVYRAHGQVLGPGNIPDGPYDYEIDGEYIREVIDYESEPYEREDIFWTNASSNIPNNELLIKLLASFQPIGDKEIQEKVLKKIIEAKKEINSSTYMSPEEFNKKLHKISKQKRPGFIQDLIKLIPPISKLWGPDALDEIEKAINDIYRWWP